MNLKKVWSDPVWSKVISGGILFAIGAIYSSVHWWGQVHTALTAAWLFAIADVPVPRWFFWILVLCVVLGIALVGALILTKSQEIPDERLNYKEDDFLNLLWRWRYEGGQVSHLNAYCNYCDYQLDIDISRSYSEPCTDYLCPNCGRTNETFNMERMHIENRVIKLIQLKLRNGGWKQARQRKVFIS